MSTYIQENIQDFGVNYQGPIAALKPEYQTDFRNNYDLDDDEQDFVVTGVLADFDHTSDRYNEVEFSHFDENDFESLKSNIFTKHYDMYLVYTTCGNWRNQTGYMFKKEEELLSYEGDCQLDYTAHSPHYKIFSFRYASHDVPTGTTHYYIGLTDQEYTKLLNASFEEIIDFAEDKVSSVKWVNKW